MDSIFSATCHRSEKQVDCKYSSVIWRQHPARKRQETSKNGENKAHWGSNIVNEFCSGFHKRDVSQDFSLQGLSLLIVILSSVRNVWDFFIIYKHACGKWGCCGTPVGKTAITTPVRFREGGSYSPPHSNNLLMALFIRCPGVSIGYVILLPFLHKSLIETRQDFLSSADFLAWQC